MKKRETLVIVIIIIFMAAACKKKSDNPLQSSVNNGFTLKGVFYSTPNGVYVHEGDTLFDFMFYSNSISWNHVEQQWSGAGNSIEFSELIPVSLQNHFPVGNYIYNDNPGAGFFTDGGTARNYSFDADTGYMMDCLHGNVSIVPVGTQFQITYTLHNGDSAVAAGSYTGNLQDISSWIGKMGRSMAPGK
jgi:hypothetical protein